MKWTGSLALAALLSTPALAVTALIRNLVSDSGDTTVTIELYGQESSQPGARIGRYQQANGAGGILLNTGRIDLTGFYMQFQDTSGAERCVGRMNLLSNPNGERYESIWYVDGTVSGYRCSTVGQNFRLNLRDTRVQASAPAGIADVVVQHLTRNGGGTVQPRVSGVRVAGNYEINHVL